MTGRDNWSREAGTDHRRDPFDYLDDDYWIDHEIDAGIAARADRADAIVDWYDPDDREPMGGDPYWREPDGP